MSKIAYRAVYEELHRRIRERLLIPGELMPGEKRLAEEYQVSRTTARKALQLLSERGFISSRAGVGWEVLRSAPGPKAPSRPWTIGIDPIAPGWGAYYQELLMKGILDAAQQDSCRLTVLDNRNPKTLNVAGIDGLLMMWVGDENYAPYAALAEKGLPIAFINRQPENPRFSFFSVDYTREAYRAVEYLLMAGHREIMMVTGGGASMELRERGYYQAFAARRLPSPSGLVLRDPTVDELAGVLKERRPTAAFLLFGCQTPTFAVAAERAGLQIPGDVSLICFDDMDRVAGVSFPVSCIRMPLFQMGQAALTHLLRRLEEPETEPVRRIVGAELCINSSCRILEP